MSNFANPQEPTYILQAILASATASLPAVVFANDLTKGLYRDVDGIHLSGLTETPSDNSEATSKAYVDAQIGGVTLPLLAEDGSTSAPTYSFATNHGTGTSYDSTNNLLQFSEDGVGALQVSSIGNSRDNGPLVNPLGNLEMTSDFQILGSASGTAAEPDIVLAPHTGFFAGVNIIKISTNSVEVARFDASSTAHDTRFLLWDVDKAALVRVSVGAADSGGSGFKVLRVPN